MRLSRRETRSGEATLSKSDLMVLQFKDMSNLVGHFMLSPKGRRETEETVEEAKKK